MKTTTNTNTSNKKVVAKKKAAAKKAKSSTSTSSRKKPEGMPKRPLSAYNLFFRQERARLLSSLGATPLSLQAKKPGEHHRTPHRKIGFGQLGRTIACKWRNLEPSSKAIYKAQAAVEKEKYNLAINDYYRKEQHGLAMMRATATATAPPNNAVASLPTIPSSNNEVGVRGMMACWEETGKIQTAMEKANNYPDALLGTYYYKQGSSSGLPNNSTAPPPDSMAVVAPSIIPSQKNTDLVTLETTKSSISHEEQEPRYNNTATHAPLAAASLEEWSLDSLDDSGSDISEVGNFDGTSSETRINWMPVTPPLPVAIWTNATATAATRNEQIYGNNNEETFEDVLTKHDEIDYESSLDK